MRKYDESHILKPKNLVNKLNSNHTSFILAPLSRRGVGGRVERDNNYDRTIPGIIIQWKSIFQRK